MEYKNTMATDISGNPLPLPKLAGIKTLGDIFKRMEGNTSLESFVETAADPMTEKEMEAPVPATREDFLSQTNNNMTLKQQFASLAKFKDVPMTYSEMRERYG
jgi:hypothetical protein